MPYHDQFGIQNNPLVHNVFVSNVEGGESSLFTDDFIVTENYDYIMTEDFNFIMTET